ncbi:hypothetical protein [Streptomyces sp. ISL-98]|uniref:hypothetical protein n=1 Tax=Streptomyces sp. ISL-98 TaxID=2819192 RepID=UPI0020361539|nr:hypothetical protein [Streptomyces sp. ISL-98]
MASPHASPTRPPGAAAAALAVSHSIADRRVPGKGVLEKLADKTGKTSFYRLADFGMNGAFSELGTVSRIMFGAR